VSNVPATLKALTVPMDSLVPYARNARRGNVDAIAASLLAHGQYRPVVARKATNEILAGNHTFRAAQQLGWDEIAVTWVECDDEEAARIVLVDNRSNDTATYDEHALAELLSSLPSLDGTGYDQAAFDELLASIEPEPAPIQDEDAVPESAPALTRPGDIWICGEHRVMCGDSTDGGDVALLMDGGLADAVWTDPPYGVSYVGKTADALEIKNDGAKGLEVLLAGAFDSILAAARPGAAVYVAAPAGPQGVPFANELLARDLFRQRLVWVKNTMVLGHSDYHYKHEDIYFGYKPGEGRRGRGGKGWYGDNAQTSVIEFDKPSRNAEHPTMKPVGLITYCLGNSTKPRDVVLDLFGGSGSTLIAAQATGRRARLMELDPRYIDVICRRYQEATGVLPVLEATEQATDFTQV
jgi:DNA modification methylase